MPITSTPTQGKSKSSFILFRVNTPQLAAYRGARSAPSAKRNSRYSTLHLDRKSYTHYSNTPLLAAEILYLVADLEVGPCDSGFLHLGYDGPIRVWLNGEQVLDAGGTNPATPDESSIAVKFRHGANQLAIALDSNDGKAWGIFARYEKA